MLTAIIVSDFVWFSSSIFDNSFLPPFFHLYAAIKYPYLDIPTWVGLGRGGVWCFSHPWIASASIWWTSTASNFVRNHLSVHLSIIFSPLQLQITCNPVAWIYDYVNWQWWSEPAILCREFMIMWTFNGEVNLQSCVVNIWLCDLAMVRWDKHLPAFTI